MQQILIEFRGTASDVDDDARRLQEWLAKDPDLRGSVGIRLQAPEPGEQGAIADAVHVLSELAPYLSGPLCIWVESRLRSRPLTVRLRRPDGAEAEVSAEPGVDPGPVLEQVREFLDGYEG